MANLEETGEKRLHMFSSCPFQAVPNNRELIGDTEKVIALIDDYDKVVSDNSNDLESFSNTYMFQLLGDSFTKKGISFDALQCSSKYRRNFPVDFLGDAQAVQALIAVGLPRQVAFDALSFIDDVDYVLHLIEEEKEGIPDLGIEEDASEFELKEEDDKWQSEE